MVRDIVILVFRDALPGRVGDMRADRTRTASRLLAVTVIRVHGRARRDRDLRVVLQILGDGGLHGRGLPGRDGLVTVPGFRDLLPLA